MGLKYIIEVDDNGTPKLRKFTDGVNNAGKAMEKSTFVTKTWNQQFANTAKNLVGWYAVVRTMTAAVRVSDEYAKSITELGNKLGRDLPKDVQKYNQAMEKLRKTRMELGETLLPVLNTILEKMNWWLKLQADALKGASSIFGGEKPRTGPTISTEEKMGAAVVRNGRVISYGSYALKPGDEGYVDPKNKGKIDYSKGFSPAADYEVKQSGARITQDLVEKNRLDAIDQWAEKQKEIDDQATAAEARRLQAIFDQADAEKSLQQLRTEAAQSAIGNALALADMFKDSNAGMFGMAKGLAVAQATMNTYEAATKAMAAYPPPFGQLAAATAVAFGMAQVAQISSTQYQAKREGGLVSGSGNGTSDNVMVRMSPGEGVLTERDINKAGGFNRIKRWIDNGGAGGVTVNINGDIVGDDRYVRDRFIPALKRAGTRL